mmetsp:Transcript_17600/g.43250  ORF Transcript_17600/g.43250 Transcript_17600/m.43250 type:complete len:134 (+) Transcript_17600:8-409(+)
MAPNYFSTLKKLTIAAGILVVTVAGHAQMDYAVAESTTGFATTTETSDDDILIREEGVGKLENGFAEIRINPAIADLIDGDRIEDMVKVSIQLDGKSNGVYITKKNRNSFIISELMDGKSNAKFTYELIVKDL